MLMKDRTKRLGCMKAGAEDIKRHRLGSVIATTIIVITITIIITIFVIALLERTSRATDVLGRCKVCF